MPEIDLTDVDSTLIAQAGYDRDSATLRIRFQRPNKFGQDTYDYAGVPDELATRFFGAPSIGGFFLGEIKPKFVGVPLPPPGDPVHDSAKDPDGPDDVDLKPVTG